MKKHILLFAILMLCAGARLQAAPVSPERALRIAQQLFSYRPATKAASLKIVWDGEIAQTKGAEPAFYVIAHELGGFVIIAGDDNVPPVLAISEKNPFRVEGMPANVRWWMEQTRDFVRGTRVQTSGVREQWMLLEGGTKAAATITGEVTDKVEKLTPEWNQGNTDVSYFGRSVFNTFCPKEVDILCVTGCLATAMAEVLTCQSGLPGVTMPDRGEGTVGGYAPDAGCYAPAQYELGVTYDWAGLRSLTNTDAIREVVNANTTEGNALLDNLAQLMLDLGASVEASYSCYGTAAYFEDIPPCLAKYFGFNKNAYFADASAYSPRLWSDKLKAELDQRPMIMAGSDWTYGSHAFVLDGYGQFMDQRVFHVNFGWGGYDNGYYLVTNLDTGGNGNFVLEMGGAFDLYPAPGSEYVAKLGWYNSNGADRVGITSNLDRIIAGEDFRLNLCLINNGNSAYTGELKLVLQDKSGTEKAVLATIDIADLNPMYFRTCTNYGPYRIDEPAFGDKIVAYYSTGTDSWAPMMDGGVPGSVIPEWPVLPRAFIRTEASYSNGDWFQLRLMNQNYLYAGTVWTFTAPDGSSEDVNQSDIEYQLTQTGTWKVSAEVKPSAGADTVETLVTYITVN